MSENNATQPVLTDEEIRAVWVEHGLDDEAVEDFARAIESALLSKLRPPVADVLPEWEQISAKRERGEALTALELFVYDNEPAGDDDTWRDQLAAALSAQPDAQKKEASDAS